MIPWASPSPQSKRHLDWFTVLQGSLVWQTDRPRYSVGNNRPHLRTWYGQCGLKTYMLRKKQSSQEYVESALKAQNHVLGGDVTIIACVNAMLCIVTITMAMMASSYFHQCWTPFQQSKNWLNRPKKKLSKNYTYHYKNITQIIINFCNTIHRHQTSNINNIINVWLVMTIIKIKYFPSKISIRKNTTQLE